MVLKTLLLVVRLFIGYSSFVIDATDEGETGKVVQTINNTEISKSKHHQI